MRKLLLSTISLALIAGSFTSCKKGEEDPFLSFRSRDARITGTWELSEHTSTRTTTTMETTSNDVNSNSNVFEETEVMSETYNGSNWTTTTSIESTENDTESNYSIASQSFESETTETEIESVTTDVKSVTLTISIYKDNTYKVERTQTDVSYSMDQTTKINGTGFTSESDTTYSPADVNNSTYDEGEWYWFDSRKKKIAISAGPLSGHILQLKNKELIITENYTDGDNNTDHTQDMFLTHNDNDPGEEQSGVETVESNVTVTYEKKQIWTKTDKTSKRED